MVGVVKLLSSPASLALSSTAFPEDIQTVPYLLNSLAFFTVRAGAGPGTPGDVPCSYGGVVW